MKRLFLILFSIFLFVFIFSSLPVKAQRLPGAGGSSNQSPRISDEQSPRISDEQSPRISDEQNPQKDDPSPRISKPEGTKSTGEQSGYSDNKSNYRLSQDRDGEQGKLEFGIIDDFNGNSLVVSRFFRGKKSPIAFQGSLGFHSDGMSQYNFSIELQYHIFAEKAGGHSFFTGAGLAYEDLDYAEHTSLYMPLGVEYQVHETPFRLRAYTTAAIVNNDDTVIDIFRNNFFGVMYSF